MLRCWVFVVPHPGDCEVSCSILLFAELKRDTTLLVKATSIETIESQRQQDQLYSGLPNLVEEGKHERPLPFSDVMANLATVHEETPSLLDEDDDTTPMRQVSKSLLRWEG